MAEMRERLRQGRKGEESSQTGSGTGELIKVSLNMNN